MSTSARILTYQARTDGDALAAQAYPVTRATLVKVFEHHLLARKVFVRASGRPALHYARLLEGLGYHPAVVKSLVELDGEELVKLAAQGARSPRADDRFERFATFELFDASLRAKKKDVDPLARLSPALGTELDCVVYRDCYVRLLTGNQALRATLLRGLLDRVLRACAAPRTAPLPDGIAARIDDLSESVGISIVPESLTVTEDALTIALWRGRVRLTGVEAPPFISQANERADLRYDRRAETWQLSETMRACECPLGPFGYSRAYLREGLRRDDADQRIESFERLAHAALPNRARGDEDLDAYLAALSSEREPAVRAAAIAAVPAFGEQAARQPLLCALGDDAPEVRAAAATAIAHAPALAAEPSVRHEAERLLIRSKDDDEARALLALYARTAGGGRVAFLEGLSGLQSVRVLAPLLETVGFVGSLPGEDRRAAATLLKRHGRSKREDVIESLKTARGLLRRKPGGDAAAP